MRPGNRSGDKVQKVDGCPCMGKYLFLRLTGESYLPTKTIKEFLRSAVDQRDSFSMAVVCRIPAVVQKFISEQKKKLSLLGEVGSKLAFSEAGKSYDAVRKNTNLRVTIQHCLGRPLKVKNILLEK